MSFTAFTLESSYSNCEPINDYILTGKGDRATVLTGQGYTGWDTEEFSAMLDWMRNYNQKMPEEKKVRFYGTDVLSFQGSGRGKVLAYVQKYAPGKAPTTDSLFRVLASEENNWPHRLNQSILQSTFMPLHELIEYFTTNKDKLVAISSLNEWEQASKHLEVMQQSLYVNLKDVPPAYAAKKLGRDAYQAQNLFHIMAKERPDTKFMIWQSNGHISKRAENKGLGHYLNQALGDKYYALSFECYEGTFQARALLPDGFWGDLKADTILPVQKSLGWYLKSSDRGKLFLNLRNHDPHSIVEKWLETPIPFSSGGWLYTGAKKTFPKKTIKDSYDGILFIERSTPARPTKNALARSAARIGF